MASETCQGPAINSPEATVADAQVLTLKRKAKTEYTKNRTKDRAVTENVGMHDIYVPYKTILKTFLFIGNIPYFILFYL